MKTSITISSRMYHWWYLFSTNILPAPFHRRKLFICGLILVTLTLSPPPPRGVTSREGQGREEGEYGSGSSEKKGRGWRRTISKIVEGGATTFGTIKKRKAKKNRLTLLIFYLEEKLINSTTKKCVIELASFSVLQPSHSFRSKEDFYSAFVTTSRLQKRKPFTFFQKK